MDARLCRSMCALIVLSFAADACAAQVPTASTRNFVVTAPTSEIARQVADAAEVFRREIAIEWLGHELPPWYAPCPIRVRVGQLGASGQTTFSFHASQNGPDEVYGWDMQIQGSLERILDSVLPHEVSHTIFACHFRRPLPRWADEGAATLVEHESERQRQVHMTRQVIDTQRRIPLKKLFSLKDYPTDQRDIMTLYAEGYSVAELLVQKGGKARYLKFLSDAHQRGWEQAVQTHYGFRSVDDLERQWHDWVIAGSPEIKLPEGQQLARNDSPPVTRGQGEFRIRGQSPDKDPEPETFGDPFLETTVAMIDAAPSAARSSRVESTAGRQLPVTRREPALPKEEPRKDSAPDQTAHNRNWLPEGNAAPARTSDRPIEESGDDGHWVDAPRSVSRERRPLEKSESSTKSRAGDRSVDATGLASRPLPSVVRQRQSQIAASDAGRLRREPTPWSEFPSDERLGSLTSR